MTIRLEHAEDGVVTVLIDRPAKRNALTVEMFRQFGEAFTTLDADDAVRCIVVRGTGGHFCAGSDIDGFDDDRDGREQARRYADFTVAMTDCLKLSRHPTIACIQGACVGGGLEIATMCDIRVADRSARFGIPVNRIGLTVDYRELVDLIDIVGHTTALEMLLEGSIFGAEEALNKRVITRIAQDMDVVDMAYGIAATIARTAPLVNRWHKKFVRRLREQRPLTGLESNEAYDCFDTEDYRIGRAAFARKERPAFVGR